MKESRKSSVCIVAPSAKTVRTIAEGRPADASGPASSRCGLKPHRYAADATTTAQALSYPYPAELRGAFAVTVLNAHANVLERCPSVVDEGRELISLSMKLTLDTSGGAEMSARRFSEHTYDSKTLTLPSPAVTLPFSRRP